MPPKVILSINVTLRHVVDLTDPTVQAALDVTSTDLLGPWRLAQYRSLAKTQLIGAAAREADIEALIAPSATHAGYKNLVVMVDRLRKKSKVELFVGKTAALPAAVINGTYTPTT